MSRRDLTWVHAGPKPRYQAYPHTRPALVNMRDLAITDGELDIVARIADEFDFEDRIYIKASRALRRMLDSLAFEASTQKGVSHE